jgi:hypothetical protein
MVLGALLGAALGTVSIYRRLFESDGDTARKER